MQKIAGTHLIVDAYVKDASVLAQDNMLKLFDKLVEALGMQYLTPTVCKQVPTDTTKLSTDDDDGGWSYYCMITTSHIAAHTWELRKAIMFDVFSCKPFDCDVAMQVMNEYLDFATISRQDITRRDPGNQPQSVLSREDIANFLRVCP